MYDLKAYTPTQGVKSVVKYNFKTKEIELDVRPYGNIKTKNFTILRCSELKDKWGNMIFENNIVKYDEQLIGEVKFTKGKFVVEFKQLIVDLCDINDKILIIGDVYAKKIE
nr:MAG TPA: YopX protein [Caudoviricetes sp.]